MGKVANLVSVTNIFNLSPSKSHQRNVVTNITVACFYKDVFSHGSHFLSRPLQSIGLLKQPSNFAWPSTFIALDSPLLIWLFSCWCYSVRPNPFGKRCLYKDFLTSDWSIYCWPGFFGFIQFFDNFVAGWHLRGAQDSNIIQEYLLNIFIFKDSFYLTF